MLSLPFYNNFLYHLCHSERSEESHECIFCLYSDQRRKLCAYVGVTNNLHRRMQEHKQKTIEGFTKKYNLVKLVFFEGFNNVSDALLNEKRIKDWTREKKNPLITSMNPEWKELYEV